MKITVNLVATRPRLALPLIAVVWMFGIVFTVLAMGLVVSTIDLNSQRPNLERRLALLSEQLQVAAQKQPLPPDVELASMRERVGAFNAISATRGLTSVQMLGWIEKALPEKVYLTSLHHRPRDRETLLVAEAATAEPLTEFLLRLEREPRFQEVLLSKQGSRKTPTSTVVRFEVRVREKP